MANLLLLLPLMLATPAPNWKVRIGRLLLAVLIALVLQVTDIPRTRSGKMVELAVREVVHGRPVKNQEALANPEALSQFTDRVELRQ